ncbi:hypothetical protein BGX31_010330 [Mortierella sp. GBA43]|nr:hypothetical protein BGX31_010330 [Mortierella sp. GBA43]
MYDEQSVRSTHSSRASSIVAAHPSAPAYVNPAALPNSVEYMDVDVESTDVAPQPHPSAAQGHGVPGSPPAITHESQLENAGQPDHAMAAQRSTTFSALGSGITRMAQDPASDSVSLYTGLSNPRGGTSISSSLLPIRPDSDDDDDMEHEATSDHGFTVAQADAQTHGRSRLRPRRNVDPAMVAGLIHDQIVQSLREAADVAPSTDRAPAEPVQTVQSSQEQQAMHSHTNAQAPNNSDINTGSSSAMNAHTDSPVERVHVTLHRRRPRSASMRGLLGFQPTDELAADEQPAPQTSNPESTADPSTSPSTESDERPPNAAMDRSQFLLSQLPFFIRLIADLSRSMRPLNGEEELPADSSSETSTTLPSESGASDTNATIGSETDTPLTSASPSPEPGTERPARRHTTIRLIQIGGVPGARNRTRSGAAAANGDEGTQGERGEGQEVRTGEDIAEAVIMFFPGPPEDNHADTETGDSPDGTDQARPRNRNASQWVVLTLSGAASASSSYDDLWALANLIGPARPVTTTQEAIDNAGFPVGKFEHEVQGMRDITTLGDCSKCLVCMSEYEEGENMRALKCKHGFHQECIDKWLTTGANKCPICRAAAVVTESETTTPGIDAIPAALNEE